MKLTIKSWILAFAFLVLIGAGLAYAEGEKEYWNGPGWYMTCDWDFGADILAGPYADNAACKAVLPYDDEDCDYYCDYVDASNLQDYEHYY